MRTVEGMTFRTFMRYYVRHCRTYNTPGTIATKRVYLRRYLEHFGKRELRAIARADVVDYLERRKPTASNATLNRELSTLKAFFNHAVALEILASNPVKGVRFLPERHKPRNIPTFTEILDLAMYCLEPNPDTGEPNDPTLYDLVIIAAMTGLRRGDILTIQGADIDLERRLLKVSVQKTGDEEYIPLNDTVYGVLARRKQPGFIFVNGDTHLKSFRRRWNRAKRATGFPYRFHDIRHGFAIKILGEGADIITIKYLLRHKRLSTTQKYLAVVDKRVRAAVDTLNVIPVPSPHRTFVLPGILERATGLEPATLNLEDKLPGGGWR